MRTIKYALAVFLLTAAGMLAVLVLLWAFEVWHVGAPGDHKLAAFTWQFGVVATVTAALAAGGVALLQSSRPVAPRKRFDAYTARNILLVAHPRGCELLEFIDGGPTGEPVARVILDGAFNREADRKIYIRAMDAIALPTDETDGKVYAAIEQARALYP